MEPRIQYAKTEDGVNIAYAIAGSGSPIFWLSSPIVSHVELEWNLPLIGIYLQALASKRKLIRFDQRGVGLSDRNVRNLSLEARLFDLEAVVDRIGAATFPLIAAQHAAPVAIAYAIRHPGRISHLVLADAVARGADLRSTPQGAAILDVLSHDWEMFTENVGGIAAGWGRDEAGEVAKFIRVSITHDEAIKLFAQLLEVDVNSMLTNVNCRTLVLLHGALPYSTTDVARGIAASIPNARLVSVEGTWADNQRDFIRAIDEFLDEGAHEDTQALPQGMTAILFLDIAGSTELTTKLGDAAYREKERELDAALRSAITEAGGTPVEGKVLGDGVMAVFTSARQAIDAAQRCCDLGNQAGLPLHLGIHAGDVVREGNNVHGGAVQVASRVQSEAAPGEILVSQTVRDLARTSAGVQFEDRGEHELKGIPEPQRLFAVRAPD